MSSGKHRVIRDTLRSWYYTYGAHKEHSSGVGGIPFDSQVYDSFIKNCGIQKRIPLNRLLNKTRIGNGHQNAKINLKKKN